MGDGKVFYRVIRADYVTNRLYSGMSRLGNEEDYWVLTEID